MDKIRLPYGKPAKVAIATTGETLTQQHFKDQCDINNIMRRYEKTGQIDFLQANPGVYDDVSDIVDYQEALNIQIAAESAFMALPSKLRKDFDNDPGKFLAFAHDEKNREKMIEYGLIERPIDPVIPVVKLYKEDDNPS